MTAETLRRESARMANGIEMRRGPLVVAQVGKLNECGEAVDAAPCAFTLKIVHRRESIIAPVAYGSVGIIAVALIIGVLLPMPVGLIVGAAFMLTGIPAVAVLVRAATTYGESRFG